MADTDMTSLADQLMDIDVAPSSTSQAIHPSNNLAQAEAKKRKRHNDDEETWQKRQHALETSLTTTNSPPNLAHKYRRWALAQNMDTFDWTLPLANVEELSQFMCAVIVRHSQASTPNSSSTTDGSNDRQTWKPPLSAALHPHFPFWANDREDSEANALIRAAHERVRVREVNMRKLKEARDLREAREARGDGAAGMNGVAKWKGLIGVNGDGERVRPGMVLRWMDLGGRGLRGGHIGFCVRLRIPGETTCLKKVIERGGF